jgi:hypothetical protein
VTDRINPDSSVVANIAPFSFLRHKREHERRKLLAKGKLTPEINIKAC